MWTIYCVCAAFLVYLVYNFAAIKLFGIPNSLSDTYYLYKEKKSWMRYLFPIMMTTVVALLMPSWLTLSEGSNWQFLSFLAAGGILFVGAAPAFKNGGMEYRVHSISAYCAAAFSLLWVALVSGCFAIIPLFFLMFFAIAWVSETMKRAYIYWLETVAFMSTFVSIILYYF